MNITKRNIEFITKKTQEHCFDILEQVNLRKYYLDSIEESIKKSIKNYNAFLNVLVVFYLLLANFFYIFHREILAYMKYYLSVIPVSFLIISGFSFGFLLVIQLFFYIRFSKSVNRDFLMLINEISLEYNSKRWNKILLDLISIRNQHLISIFNTSCKTQKIQILCFHQKSNLYVYKLAKKAIYGSINLGISLYFCFKFYILLGI